MKYIFHLFSLVYGKFCFIRAKEFGKGSKIGFPANVLSSRSIVIGNHVNIGSHVWLNCKWNKSNKHHVCLKIGDGSYIGRFCQINAWESVTIEDNVLIGDNVLISDSDHIFDNNEVPIIHQGDKFKGAVHIKSGSWIGRNAVILPGVVIGHNAVVGSNSVVTKSVPDNVVVGGVPARVIKDNTKNSNK